MNRVLVEIVGVHNPCDADLIGTQAIRYTAPTLAGLLRLSPEGLALCHSRYLPARRVVVRDIGPVGFDGFAAGEASS